MHPSATPETGRSLGQAVVTALILLGLVVVSYLLGREGFFVLVSVVVLIALFELLDALVQRGGRPIIPFGLVCGFGLLVAAYVRSLVLIPAVLAVTVAGALMLALRRGRGPDPVGAAAWTVLGVVWIGGGGAAAVSILMIEPEDGLLLLIAFVLITALDDIGAYFAGTRFGAHKMAPSISPGKSWEGFAGGFASAIAGGAIFAGLLFDLNLSEGLGLGAVCGLLAPAGDLVESLAKREMGIKDSGRLLPGHGGLLDRLDAIVFCAPAAYLYLRFIVVS